MQSLKLGVSRINFITTGLLHTQSTISLTYYFFDTFMKTFYYSELCNIISVYLMLERFYLVLSRILKNK